MRHMANLESVLTYEGTPEMHTLVIGQALTGQQRLPQLAVPARGRSAGKDRRQPAQALRSGA